jgi:hypothetical protein
MLHWEIPWNPCAVPIMKYDVEYIAGERFLGLGRDGGGETAAMISCGPPEMCALTVWAATTREAFRWRGC